jgi:bacterioferritin-associated ferredoxin
MELTSSKQQLETFYCFCSEMSNQEILQKQKENPLDFIQFLEQHTSCNKGCGSCVGDLYTYLSDTNCLIE